MQVHHTREEWLTEAITLARATIPNLPARIRAACGFPSTYRRSGTLAESWPDTASGDGTWEILISPTVEAPESVLALLLAQLAHATPGAASRASAPWRTLVVDVLGLAPADEGWKTLTQTEDFSETWGGVLTALGSYPHAAIQAGTKATQATRMIKCLCPSCGWTFRTTAKWIAKGLPTCACGDTFNAETGDAE